jgi:hypothetical protein
VAKPQYGTTVAGLSGARAPVLHATSRKMKKKGQPARGREAAQFAMGFMSSSWARGNMIPVAAQAGQASLRVVVVDGAPYGVVSQIRVPRQYRYKKNAAAQQFAPVVRANTGCQVSSSFYSRSDGYGALNTLAFPLNC